MRRILTRMMHWGAAIIVLSQSAVLADNASSSAAAEPVVSVAAAPPVEGNVDDEKVAPSNAVEESVEVVLAAKPRPLFQHATYPAAWRAAQKSNRPILVFVSMPNCHYCVKMKQQVYQLHHVQQLVSSSFETVYAGRYTHAKLIEKLHIKWYPTTVLVGPNNKILDVIEGYAEATKFQQRLQTGLAALSKPETTQLR